MPLSCVRPSRALRVTLPLLAALTLPVYAFLLRPALAQTTVHPVTPHDEWLGMYLGKQKIGYSGTHVTPTTYQNKPSFKSTTHGVTKMQLLGREVTQEEDSVTITDAEDHLLAQTFNVLSNGSAIHVDAVYDYAHHTAHCTIGQGAGATKKDLDIPAGAKLTGDSNNLTEGQKLAVGQKIVFTYLEPLSVQFEEATVEVIGQDTVRDDAGKQVSAFRLKSQMSVGQVTSWADAEGHMIKSEINLGVVSMVMVSEPKAHAMDRSAISLALTETPAPGGKTYTPPADFAVATAIATEKPISDPRSVSHLNLVIDGIPSEKLILSDDRQQETRVTGHPAPPYEVNVKMTVESVDEKSVPRLPIKDAALAPYLKAAPYLPVGDANIQKTALQVKGHETNPYRIATNLRDWVHNAMTPDPTIGVPRSATDIFQRRRGVCRDYATLYTALARAAGVPTRLCSGIVYGDFQGKSGFYYHAWAESWVGKWVAFDPTLFDPSHPVNYVDATHIKFAQGDVTQMFEMVSIVGKLKITVE